MPRLKKLNNIPVRLPAKGSWPPQDVFVNFRIVASTNVDRVGWDNAKNMYVRYHNGRMYVYLGVNRQRVVAAALAESTGSYINRKIKGQYNFIELP